MIRILLIRHGSTDLLGHVLYGRMPGVHLNAEGLRQAETVSQALKERYDLDAIISSPLERALETARPIAEIQSKPVNIDAGINEIDFGKWVGKSFAELSESQRWNAFNRRRSIHCAPEGESMMRVQARAWQVIEGVINTYQAGSTLALVTHGDVIRSILLLILGAPIDHIHRLEIAPCSVSELMFGEHEPVVKYLNQKFY
jgi:broad specificity phosphatase PhoE